MGAVKKKIRFDFEICVNCGIVVSKATPIATRTFEFAFVGKHPTQYNKTLRFQFTTHHSAIFREASNIQ